MEFRAKVMIRLPSGERLTRKFRPNDKLQILYDFIETRELSPMSDHHDFLIVNTYPRKELKNHSQSIKEAQLYPSGSVVVEELLSDDDD